MNRLRHIPWLVLTLVLSLAVFSALDPFAGQGTGSLILFWLVCFAVSHAAALIVGLVYNQKGKKKIFLVSTIALAPICIFSVFEAKDAIYLRNFAVYDRFRDNLGGDIPDSVTNLKFIDLEKKIETHLMFEFSISPDELDQLIREMGFTKIRRDEFRRPDDYFIFPAYLPLSEPCSFYVLNDISAGYPEQEIGEGFTLKVSSDRTEVVFRRESAPYYKYRYWENDRNQQRRSDFLRTINQKSEQGSGGNG